MENGGVKCLAEKLDILQIVPDNQLENLRNVFKNDWPSHVLIYNFIDTCMRWKNDKRFKKFVSIYSVEGDWSDGTFVAILELNCYDLVVYSLDMKIIRLQEALKKTKLIQWDRKISIPSIRIEFKEPLWRTKEEITHPFLVDIPSYIWWLPKEKAIQYTWSLPQGYYVISLNQSHAKILNERWPHKTPGSESHIADLLNSNGGIGLFSEETGDLCAWVLKNYFGSLGMLQVDENHKRKGFGTLVAKIFSKMLAEQGLDITGCIALYNTASQEMFTKLGFEKIAALTWLRDFL